MSDSVKSEDSDDKELAMLYVPCGGLSLSCC